MTITASMVRELREMTGGGMMQCKKALEASGGDLQGAVDHLRKQGLKSAAKKSQRETSEGRVLAAITPDGRRGHLVAVACETDFLAKGDGFRALVDELAEIATASDPDGLDTGDRPFLEQPRSNGAGTVTDLLEGAVAEMGENIRVVDFARLESRAGLVGAYVHHDGKQAAMAAVRTGADAAGARDTLKALCQHIAVYGPEHANREDVPDEAVEREKAVIMAGNDVQKKPEDIRQKIATGRLEKFFAGIVLAEQPWIHDDKQSTLKALRQRLGDDARIEAFHRFKIG